MASRRRGLLYFGVDIQAQLSEWWFGQKLPELRRRFGNNINLYFALLDPTSIDMYDPGSPLEEMLYELASHEGELAPDDDAYDLFYGPTGLRANVGGKLRFVMRTGRDSDVAETRPDLLEPGDFPFEGAGTYYEYRGGVSGLKKEDDGMVFREIVEKVIELRAAAAQVAVDACKGRAPGDGPTVKYLGGFTSPYYRGDDVPQVA